MKIYTKTGDQGETGLYGGKRVAKHSEVIDAIGNVDELNALLGVIISKLNKDEIEILLETVQKDLFVVGADLATPKDVNEKLKVVRLKHSSVEFLENNIDNLEKELPGMKFFILPGGSETGSLLHLARAVCRRAERSVVYAHTKEEINSNILKYINRLSDLLFIVGRYVNKSEKFQEQSWKT